MKMYKYFFFILIFSSCNLLGDGYSEDTVARVAFSNGKFQEASEIYSSLISKLDNQFYISSDDKQVKCGLLAMQALCQCKLGNYTQAESIIVDAEAISGNRNSSDLNVKAQIYLKRGLLKNAMDACDNGSDEGRYIKGLIELEMNDLESAMKTFTSLIPDRDLHNSNIEDNPRSSVPVKKSSQSISHVEAKAFVARALLKIKLNDYNSALEDLGKVGSKFEHEGVEDIENEVFYMNKAFCYYKIGEIKKACKYWGKAGEKGNSTAYEFIKLFWSTPEGKK
jgi:tetratricopeptide (TPR) repeat protein